jgi:hypothetical protein
VKIDHFADHHHHQNVPFTIFVLQEENHLPIEAAHENATKTNLLALL